MGSDINAKLETKVDNIAWEVASNDLEASIDAVRNIASSCRFDFNAHSKGSEKVLAAMRHDLMVVEANIQELLSAAHGVDDSPAPNSPSSDLDRVSAAQVYAARLEAE